MKRIRVIFVTLTTILLAACAAQDQGPVPVTAAQTAYSLNTPIQVLEADPRAEAILIRDVPNILHNQAGMVASPESLQDATESYGTTLTPAQLTQTQTDLAQLSQAEQRGQSPSMAYLPPAYTTSFVCDTGNTPVQNAVCANPQLASLDVLMAASVRQHLGNGNIFDRDQILATQRGWLLGLQTACNVTANNNPAADACLASAYQAQIAVLTNWPATDSAPGGGIAAISHYVHYKPLDAKQPALCNALGAQAATAMATDGSIDPNLLQGATEIAGSHGNPSGADPQGGGNIAVDLYRSGLYGGYEQRARGVTLPGASAPVLGPESVGSYVETLPNGGGRFVSFASQTSDYGNIDVFTYQGQLVALVSDVIGYNSPAPPGEAAVAAAFTLSQNSASPACLFETYLTPPPVSLGTFTEQPSLTPFLAMIDAMNTNPSAQLAPSDRQDSSYLAAETRWMLFNMPQVALEQVHTGNWTGWLRSRHDQVLDALFAWSQTSPANLAQFNKMFALLRPAAVDLDTIYVQQQGMNTNDAAQVTAIAMMELLYQATFDISPSLGAGPAAPANFTGYTPRYPILASPQS